MALIDLNAAGLEEMTAALRIAGMVVNMAVAGPHTEQGVREGMLVSLAPYEGAIDILVLNVVALISGPFETLSSEQWQQAFAINFFTHVFSCGVAVTLMKQRGLDCIIFTGSDQALQPDAGLGRYAQAKAAAHSFAKMLARELASA